MDTEQRDHVGRQQRHARHVVEVVTVSVMQVPVRQQRPEELGVHRRHGAAAVLVGLDGDHGVAAAFQEKITAAEIMAKAREFGADIVGIADSAKLNANPPDPADPVPPIPPIMNLGS